MVQIQMINHKSQICTVQSQQFDRTKSTLHNQSNANLSHQPVILNHHSNPKAQQFKQPQYLQSFDPTPPLPPYPVTPSRVDQFSLPLQGVCLDNFNFRDYFRNESTLDNKQFNLAPQTKFLTKQIGSLGSSQEDTFMPNSYHSSKYQPVDSGVAAKYTISCQNLLELSPFQKKQFTPILDFQNHFEDEDAPTHIEEPEAASEAEICGQTAVCYQKAQILNSSALPDKFTKTAEELMGVPCQQNTEIQEYFEFSGKLNDDGSLSVSDLVLDLAAESKSFHTESEPLNFKKEESSSSFNLSKHSVKADVSDFCENDDTQQVKMTVIDSQNLCDMINSQQAPQKRKISDGELLPVTNLPTSHFKRYKVRPVPVARLIELNSLEGTSTTQFRMYEDSAIGINIQKLTCAEEPLVDSCQDDDVNTDDEVIEAGFEQCFQDLMEMKDCLTTMSSEKCRQKLKTFKIWAPKFNGQLPLVQAE